MSVEEFFEQHPEVSRATDGERREFDEIYRMFPKSERMAAIIILSEMKLPTSEEFLRAYVLGVIRGLEHKSV